MIRHRISGAPFAALFLLSIARAQDAEPQLAEVVISASLRPAPVQQTPASVTVLDSTALREAGVEHFADVLGMVPDLSAAGGTSRPRYFQLRGVGEQEQYQGAPNPSVGFLIDDIDFSGVAMPATLFDVAQIEVLRGPQGTAYGANALAGLIALRSRDPGMQPELSGEATLGDYGTRALALAAGDGSATGGWRLVAQKYRSDGFRRDVFLGRDDTNGFDESTLRGKLVRQFGALRAQLTLMHVNLDNGYDAWSVDNSRISQSDQPGRDAQRSTGAALRLNYATGWGEVRSVTSAADSDIVFSFDGDWGNDAYWAATPGCVPDPSLCVPYDFVSRTDRQRDTLAEDLRFIGDDDHLLFGRARWLLGAYALRLREQNQQIDHYNGALYRQIDSRYRAVNTALYAQLDWQLGGELWLGMGLRGERRDADYADSDGSDFSPADSMVGGHVSLTRLGERHLDYLTLSRGYKAGGFNIGTAIPAERRQFRPEYLWNLEAGRKGGNAAATLNWQAALFYMRRMDQQVSTSVQIDPFDPLTYQFYTDNAARAENFGVEASFDWQPAPRWQLGGSIGALRARYLEFSYLDRQGEVRDLSGREQEYAPRLQAALHAGYRHPSGWYGRVDLQGQSKLYASASHDQRLDARQLVNLRLGYARSAWDASLWVRNLFDENYDVHAFHFGNEPPDFADKLYLQRGEPRQFGITIRYQLDR